MSKQNWTWPQRATMAQDRKTEEGNDLKISLSKSSKKKGRLDKSWTRIPRRVKEWDKNEQKVILRVEEEKFLKSGTRKIWEKNE